MSRNNWMIACVLAAACGVPVAQALTLDELSQKNREMLLLKADIDLAHKKNDLKKELAGESPVSAAGAGASVAPSGVAGTTAGAAPVVLPKAPRRAAAAPAADADALALKAVYGDENNPWVQFSLYGEDRPAVRQGEMVLPFWRLRAVLGRMAVVEHIGRDGRVVGSRTLLLPEPTPLTIRSRYEAAPTGPLPGALPRLPPLGQRQ